jgi:hypothetical protein
MPSSTAKGWEVVRVRSQVGSVIWRDERVALPRRWDAEVSHPEVPWNVLLMVAVEGGRLACEHVAISRRPGGPPVTSMALRRLPVSALLVASAWAVLSVQDPAEDDPETLLAMTQTRPPGWEAEVVARQPEAVRAELQVREPGDYSDPSIPAAALKVIREIAQPVRRPRTSDKDALLREVVDIYRAALAPPNPGRAPRKEVERELERRGHRYSRPYVGKLLVEARKKGMLGPAHVGRAGEQPS